MYSHVKLSEGLIRYWETVREELLKEGHFGKGVVIFENIIDLYQEPESAFYRAEDYNKNTQNSKAIWYIIGEEYIKYNDLK